MSAYVEENSGPGVRGKCLFRLEPEHSTLGLWIKDSGRWSDPQCPDYVVVAEEDGFIAVKASGDPSLGLPPISYDTTSPFSLEGYHPLLGKVQIFSRLQEGKEIDDYPLNFPPPPVPSE